MSRAFSLAAPSAGRSIPARMAMIAITIRSSISVKIRIFTLRSKNTGQGTRKEEVEKHWNNRTLKQWNNRMKNEKAGAGVTGSDFIWLAGSGAN